MSDDFAVCPECGAYDFECYDCDSDGNEISNSEDTDYVFCKHCKSIIKKEDIIWNHIEYGRKANGNYGIIDR